MTDDGQLLQQYTRERSESAFGELVTRHIDLVYSAALRVASGDRHLAEDVTQVARRAACRAMCCWPAGCTGTRVTPRPKPCERSDDVKLANELPWK